MRRGRPLVFILPVEKTPRPLGVNYLIISGFFCEIMPHVARWSQNAVLFFTVSVFTGKNMIIRSFAPYGAARFAS